MIRNALLASMLAVVAAGCGDDVADCPSVVTEGASCTSAGLTCFSGSTQCSCSGNQTGSATKWACKPPDMSIVEHMDLSHLPTTD